MDCPFSTTPRTVFILSHPNHELPVHGLLRHLKPLLVYLTDGGGGLRLQETQSYMSESKFSTVYLDFKEHEFYQAFLERSNFFSEKVVRRVAGVLEENRPERIFTDAVEFYNPVHDISLPVGILAAARAFQLPVRETLERFPFFEIPLVFQHPEGEYTFQGSPSDRRGAALAWRLTKGEVAKKLDAWDKRYTVLAKMMGTAIPNLKETAATETVLVAANPLREPGAGCQIRYEWRAQKLKDEGKITEIITRAKHYVPVVEALLT